MNKVSKFIGVIVVVLIALFLLRDRIPFGAIKDVFKNEPIMDTVTTIEYKYDTINNVSTVYTPQWKDRVVVDVDSIFISQTEPVDTMALLGDYYAKYNYKDTVLVDTFGYVTINDTISQNKIESRQTTSTIRIPTKIVTNTIFIDKRELYLGGSLAGNREFMMMNGEMLVRTKKRKAYGVGIGLDNRFNPTFTAKLYWRIGK